MPLTLELPDTTMACHTQVDLAGNRLLPIGLGKGKVFMTEPKVWLQGSPARHIHASGHFPWLCLATVALTLLYITQAPVPSLFLAE